MRRFFDLIDLFAAVGLFVAVAAWAFLWAHPCPHPDLWPFLVAVQGKVGSAVLGVAGRLALGVFAALVYLLFGFVGGVNPLGFVAIGFAVVSDEILRWKDGQRHGQREDDAFAKRKKAIEKWFSRFALFVGFALGVGLLAVFSAGIGLAFDFAVQSRTWWTAWTGAVLKAVTGPSALALVLAIVVALVAQAIGRRVRSLGRHGLVMCRVLFGFLTVALLAMFLRSVDRAERIRLQAIRDYAALVADGAAGGRTRGATCGGQGRRRGGARAADDEAS